jgi:uncharacterized membrane protein
MVVTATVVAVVVYHFGFRQRFEVVSGVTLRVFYDSGLTQELQQGQTIVWEQITDTTPKSQTLYIENVGTVDATLQLGYDTQQLPQGWSLTWDYGGTTVVHGAHNSGNSIQVTLTLSLPSTIDAGTYDIGSEIRATPVS